MCNLMYIIIVITVIAVFVSRARILPTRNLCVISIYQMSWYSVLEQICITILYMSVAVSFSRTRYMSLVRKMSFNVNCLHFNVVHLCNFFFFCYVFDKSRQDC